MSRIVRAGAVTALSLLALSLAVSAAGDEKLGKGVTLSEATPIAKLYETPAAFVGKTVRLDGVVSAVCEEMGCWMALADPKNGDLVVRFKVDHGGGVVFPIAARGKQASAEGVFEKIADGDAESHEAAAEHAAAQKASTFGKTYQVKATGAVIK